MARKTTSIMATLAKKNTLILLYSPPTTNTSTQSRKISKDRYHSCVLDVSTSMGGKFPLERSLHARPTNLRSLNRHAYCTQHACQAVGSEPARIGRSVERSGRTHGQPPRGLRRNTPKDPPTHEIPKNLSLSSGTDLIIIV